MVEATKKMAQGVGDMNNMRGARVSTGGAPGDQMDNNDGEDDNDDLGKSLYDQRLVQASAGHRQNE